MSESLEKQQLEQKETEPIDFLSVFNAKLEAISPSTEWKNDWEKNGLEKIGIAPLIKKIPCDIFYNREGEADVSVDELWIEDPKNCGSRYPHAAVHESLQQFLEEKGRSDTLPATASGYLLVDENNKKYLFLDKAETAEYYIRQIKSKERQRERWEKMVKKYGLEKIFGNLSEEIWDEKTGRYFETVLEPSLVEKTREENYLSGFAEKYQMTNNQFIRFHAQAMAALEAFKKYENSVDLDALAKEIIADEKE
jgi:hypothetical protein